jgi:RNA polymerase sigma-70 factor (ECF subfamily)
MQGMSTGQDEQELIARATSGDRSALERLLLMHYPGLSRHVVGKLPGSAQGTVSAEDILQEAFIQAFRDIRKFQPHSDRSFSAWLRAIAENRLRDTLKVLRRKKRGGGFRRVHGPADEQASSMADLVEMLSAGSHTPSRSVARREAVQAVQVAMAGLPEDYRRAVRLRYLEGKGLGEVAGTMRRSPGAIRGLLDRAKQRMRAALGRSSLYLSRK